MLRRKAWIAMLGALALAGCGADGKDQVLARVGAEKITTTQVDAELKASGTTRANDPQVRKAALENIIVRKLFAQAAREAKLAHTPEAQALKAAAVETFEANLERATIVATTPKPTPAEVAAYIQANPGMFAQRTGYLVERLRTPVQTDPALLEALRPTRTLEEAEAVLKARGAPYRRSLDELDTLRAPPELAASLQKLRPGEPFVIPAEGGLTIGRVRDRQVRPVTGAEATALAATILHGQRQSKALKDRAQQLRAERVSYPGKAATK